MGHFPLLSLAIYAVLFKGLSSKGVNRRINGLRDFKSKVIHAELANLNVKARPTGSWSMARLSSNSPTKFDSFSSTKNLEIPANKGKGVEVFVVDSGFSEGFDDYVLPVQTIDFTGTGTQDKVQHGTNIAAVIAGQNYGIATDSQVYVLKILDDYQMKNTKLFAALNWILEHVEKSLKKSVINLSSAIFGIKDGSASASRLDFFVQRFKELGVVFVTSSGNQNIQCDSYLSSLDGVITVGSINKYNERSSFSNYGDRVDVLAPGEEIKVPYTSDKFFYGKTVEGTSFSAAIVSAVIAVYLSIGVAPEDIRSVLTASATSGILDSDSLKGSPNLIVNITPKY